MIRGLYTSASGMVAALEKNNTISNNLSNVNTTGYKKDTTIKKSFPQQVLRRIDETSTPIGKIGGGVVVDEIATDQSMGSFRQTGNSLDLAIKGEGFFSLQTPKGIRYTRAGNFTINNQGQVVNQNGHPLRGENGILQVSNQGEITVESNNLSVGGNLIDKIQVVNFANKSGLVKEGNTLYRATAEVGNTFVSNGNVVQGFLEGSNVSAIQEMVKMISNSRAYEADQKMIKAHDDTLNKAVNQVGKA